MKQENFELVLNEKEWEQADADFMPTPEQQAVQRVVVPRGTFYMRQDYAIAYCKKNGLAGAHGIR